VKRLEWNEGVERTVSMSLHALMASVFVLESVPDPGPGIVPGGVVFVFALSFMLFTCL